MRAEGVITTKTVSKDEIGSGLNSLEWTIRSYYQCNPNLSVYLKVERTGQYGTLKNILKNEGEGTSENTYSIGAALLF